MNKILFLLLLFSLHALALAGCMQSGHGTSSGKQTAGETLKVGITPNAPPLIYRLNGGITGLEAELARGLAEFAGRELRFVEVNWVDQIPSLVSGKTDIIMSGMTKTRLRQVRIDFSDTYMVSGQVSLVRRADYNKYSDGLVNLLRQSVRIGTVRGTTGDFLIEQKVAGANTKFTTPDQGVNALMDNTIDVFVYDLPMNFYFAALHEASGIVPVPVPMTREELAWGIRKGDTELLITANSFLEHLRRQKQLQSTVQKWIPFYKKLYNQ